MSSKKLRENSLFILLSLVSGVFVSAFKSVGLLLQNLFGKTVKPLRENSFLDALNFFFHIGPKSFWKAPSGLKMGRSISTFLHYVFKKSTFVEKKK